METYRDVMRRIAELEVKATELRRAEAANVIAEMRATISKYDLRPEDIFAATSGADPSEVEREESTSTRRNKVAPKYMDKRTGATWSGRGKTPGWLIGKNREEFLINRTNSAKPEKKDLPNATRARTRRKGISSKATLSEKAITKPKNNQ